MSKTASGLSRRALEGNAGAALARAKDLPDVLDFLDLAQAAKALARTQEQKLYAEEWHLRGQRKAGGLLNPPKGRPKGNGSTLESLGIDGHESMRWQAVAAVPEDVFEAFLEFGRSDGGDITRAGLLRYSRLRPLMSSAEEDWHTPPEVVAAVVATLGRIDLDPCSNDGDPIVPARKHFRKADDGLAQPWVGRVYMNPPYGRVIDAWIEKWVSEPGVTEAIALVPSRTDTAWFRRLRDLPRCFVFGRLRFSGADPAPFPSMAVYRGERMPGFVRAFTPLGDIYRRVE